MKIIVDAMGGDNAPLAVVQGALEAHKQYGTSVILVGRMADILKAVEQCGEKNLPSGVELRDATEVVEISDASATAFKKKKDSSLTVGLSLLRDGEGDAFVSAGSTGALLGGATFVVKRIPGIRRAAMGPVIPTAEGRAVLCDCGANDTCTPEFLLQFAYLGNFYAKRMLGGTPFLGVAKPVVKAHGSSDARAIRNAILRAEEYAASGFISDIREHIELMKVGGNGQKMPDVP